MLPNFFVVGAQKAGTTSLHYYLFDHPEIYLPDIKETKFFADPKRYKKGIDAYQSHYFSGWNGEKAVGEIDPDYMYFPGSIERISRHMDLEKLKFIFLLRNPAERAFSHYQMTFRRGYESLTFEKAIKKEVARIHKDWFSKMHFSYIDRGYYRRQIQHYLQYVGRSQLFFLTLEELKTSLLESLRKLFFFLDISTDFEPANLRKIYHKGTHPKSVAFLRRIVSPKAGFEKKLARLLIPWDKPRHKIGAKLIAWNQTSKNRPVLSSDTRHLLCEHYREENRKLSELIGKNLDAWNNQNSLMEKPLSNG